MSFITAIGTAVPPYQIDQMTIADFMARSLDLNTGEKRRLLALYRASGIETRYSVIRDYGETPEEYVFYPRNKSLEPLPTTGQRMKLYQQEAIGLAVRAAQTCLGNQYPADQITHLIVVSCTGMYAPGIDIWLVKHLGLNSHVKRTAINFMGCYAAFNAMKVGHSICESEKNATVLVVCLELCSIHFQQNKADDHLLSGALFGDGAAAILMQSKSKSDDIKLKPLQFYNDLVLEGHNDMAWEVGDFGFEMKLSAYIPAIIKGGISKLTKNLFKELNLRLSDIDHFAIHPGGKKILEAIEDELKLPKNANKPAYAILRKYGNMSSPTVLFVLEEIWKHLTKKQRGEKILSFAFGPGLTLESMLLQIS